MIDFFARLAALRREGQSFAVATVVARRAPVSAHLGDRAIVFADGRMEGFVGGACAREIIRQQALEAIAARHGRLVSIRPDASEPVAATAEHVVVPMTCASEGAVDVYVEPFVRARSLIVVGATPVADALARLARSMDYDVVRVVDAGERRDVEPGSAALGVKVVSLDDLAGVVRDGALDHAAVVASQGHYDEQALEVLLKAGSAVRRAGRFAQAGRDRPKPARGERRARRRGVAESGGARPRRADRSRGGVVDPRGNRPDPGRVRHGNWRLAPAAATSAVDPVCGMSVVVASARHTAEVDGVAYYFCCANCRATFLKDPQAYLAHP